MPEVNQGLKPLRPSAPGRMTAAMRSMRQTAGPKVLRVALVVGGKLLEERIIKQRSSVTVGQSEKSTFVVEANVPPFTLFERIGDDYSLNVLGGMTGRVALPTGIVDLGTVVTLAPRPRSAGPIGALRLTEEMRGKLVLAGTTFLFQFVTPPPVQSRPRLPLAVKDGLASRIDWMLTVIVAFSFLAHFGAVGAMYSDWMDTVVDDDITVGLIHTPEPAPPPAVETTPEAAPVAETGAATAPAASSPASSSGKPRSGGPDRTPDAAVGSLLRDLDQVNFAVLGSLQGGPNLRGVMTAGDSGPPVNFDALATHSGRIGVSGALDLPAGAGGPIQLERSHSDLPKHDTGGSMAGAGQARRVDPVLDVHEESPLLSVPVANAEAVIRSQIHPGARRCYQKGLESDPSQSGKLVLAIRVAPSGEVESASVSSSGGLSASVAACIVAVAQRARFDRTAAGGATVVVPFGFFRQ